MTTDWKEPGEILGVGHAVARKLMGVWGHGGLLERTAENALTLYGLIRLTDNGGDTDAFVDRHLAAFAFAGALPAGAFPFRGLGGMAGTFRRFQGHYLTRFSGRQLRREHVARFLSAHPRHASGVLRGPGQGVRVESFLTVCPFLAMAGLALGDPGLYGEAVQQVRGLEAVLRDRESGLFHHAHDWDEKGRTTPDAWARGNGCAAAGLAETLRYLPEAHPGRDSLAALLADLLQRLLPLRTDAGLWRQDVTDASAPEETSGSALIASALAEALKNGWLGREHLAAAWRAWDGLAGRVDVMGNGNIRGVCVDTAPGETRGHYLDRPLETNDLNVFGPLMLASSAFWELARRQDWRTRPVPSRAFGSPAEPDVTACFGKAHALCESMRNDDGSWGQGNADYPETRMTQYNSESRGSHPLLRDAGYAAMGYLGAFRHGGDKVFLQRARAGLDWLVKEQEPDGCFRLYTRKAEGQVNHNGCLFVTGVAAAALAKGYERLGEERYLEASARAAAWEIAWPVTRNVNFNSFAVWHLAEHYRLTGDAAALDAAIHKAKWRLMTRQEVRGGWQGHDSWIWYHGIILRGYAALLRALPEGHGLREPLRLAASAATGYLAALQQDSGAMFPNPETHRAATAPFAVAALSMLALVDSSPAILGVLRGAVRYRMSPESGDLGSASYNDERKQSFAGNGPTELYALGAYLEMLAEQEKPS